MSRTAARATAALLCGVVLVALGLVLAAAPSIAEPTPVSLNVNLDFDPFVAGIAQTRTTDLDVPVPSRVMDAEVAGASGAAGAPTFDVDVTICRGGTCQPLTAGAELEPGAYTVAIEAVLVGRSDDVISDSGRLAGRIRIVETAESNLAEPMTLVGVAAIGLFVIIVGGLVVRPRREVAS